ncbi:MAG: protein-L-isoaspartate(D-aspartate) O-methyltransferase [Ignavibacteria bacterium]|nr:protein-L-isoaspartate(D-aspartate) O-methyltransferase [Ignavibacteria bacterium]
MTDLYSQKRKELVGILSRQGIKDKKVLEAIGKVKRELFVSSEMKRYAYDNTALPISGGQTISQPYTVAYMTELLDVRPGDKVLEIGTGSGYQAAVLCEMGAKVYSIERVHDLFENTAKRFESLPYHITMKLDDGSTGWQQFAPYDKIIVTAGSPKIPKQLTLQLKNDGIMVIPVGDKKLQQMVVIKKSEGKDGKPEYSIKKYSEFKFVPLVGEDAWK